MQQRTIALATVSGFASGLLVGYCLSRNGGARDHKESEEDFGRESQKETGEPSTPPVRFYKAGEDIDQVRAIVKRVVAHAKQTPPTKIEIKVISGGITNMLFRAGFVGSNKPPVLVRIFGAEGMIDRSVENETYKWLAYEGIAPSYYGRFVNGRCEAFHDGYQACTLEDLRNPKLSSMIARELAKLHKLKLPSHISRLHSKVGLWDQMHSWLRSAKAHKKTVPLSLQPTPFATPLGTPIPTPKQSDIDEDDDIAGGGGEEEADNSDAHVKTKNSSDHKNISKRKETKFDYTIDLTAAGGDKEGQGSSVIGHSSSSEGKRTNQSDRSRSSLQPPSSSILPENVQGLEEEGEEKKNDNKKQQNSCNSCRLSADSIEQYCSIDLNRCAHLLKELQGMLDDSKKGRRGKGGKGREMMTASTNNRHVVFCHNDLLCGNILKAPGNESVKLIDFEYGGLGYRGFDIANHFNEWAGGTLTAEEDAPGYNGVPDYSHFPTDRQQRSFCAAYLTEFNGGIAPSAVQLENLLSEVGRFVSLNHLYWGTWAINRAFEEGCDEFDYMRYATIRIMRGLLGDTEAM
mmetsp:Transcript_8172/g.13233  ORF Transcript_8172/g.13233 Transcript_8172/m.13233 type:complete len:573 (+) Transcript_8172:95-1813(+)